jgi:GTPase
MGRYSCKINIISVLKEHNLDNGRGLARRKILKHKHEQDSGLTSSINHHENEEQ